MFWQIIDPANKWFFPVTVNPSFSADGSLLVAILMFIGLIFAIVIHEMSHAWAAHLLGDDTGKYDGRLTLNPFAHFDAIGFTLIFFTWFGYGKPVRVNPDNFVNPVQGTMYVALAGPISNLIQAVIYGLLFVILSSHLPPIGSFSSVSSIIDGFIGAFILALPKIGAINLSLALFNLLPLYPLDGSRIWGYISITVDDFLQRYIYPNSLYILIFLILPLFNGISLLSYIMLPFFQAYLRLVY